MQHWEASSSNCRFIRVQRTDSFDLARRLHVNVNTREWRTGFWAYERDSPANEVYRMVVCQKKTLVNNIEFTHRMVHFISCMRPSFLKMLDLPLSPVAKIPCRLTLKRSRSPHVHWAATRPSKDFNLKMRYCKKFKTEWTVAYNIGYKDGILWLFCIVFFSAYKRAILGLSVRLC